MSFHLSTICHHFYVCGKLWNVQVQYSILGCNAETLISLTLFSFGLSELWERAHTLDKHVSVLLVLIREGKKPFSNQENIL